MDPTIIEIDGKYYLCFGEEDVIELDEEENKELIESFKSNVEQPTKKKKIFQKILGFGKQKEKHNESFSDVKQTESYTSSTPLLTEYAPSTLGAPPLYPTEYTPSASPFDSLYEEEMISPEGEYT